MRARSFIFGCLGGVSAATLVLLTFNSKPRPGDIAQAPLTPSALRVPASQHGTVGPDPLSSTICQNVYRAVCQKRGETHDPTGVVRPDADGEIKALRTYEEIIHQHPDWSSEQVDEEL